MSHDAREVPSAGGGPIEAREETAAELEEDVEVVRRRLKDVAGELERRGHRLAEVTTRVGKRAAPIAAGALVLAAGAFAFRAWRQRARRRWPARLWASLPVPATIRSGAIFRGLGERLRQARRPAPRPHPVRDGLIKIATAGGAAATSALVKRWAASPRGGDRSTEQPPAPSAARNS